MLVLTRRVNERIDIGDDVSITVVRIGPNTVKLGIEAPPETRILRDDAKRNTAREEWEQQ